ncbi:hypothetical protein O6H91_03G042400 [Diphasiastrum complanatum]|uniref:Uncharacterized protein n=3 Tax=Diphasiastrum complanatum TaxID=34168 RepID=A0ACC2E5Z8_DIPCM|nr:hypothetical protein O6H91_03G042400 [Diphasiastrum complanatum]KAJ7561815.1 hypothetical protein O6H91_03G042400 [Diphasiastrum complanatum]KAJ7561816.1 hypothetical protein O6H91_03G042400 [Diphasiastrum complanatum]
MGDLSDGEHRFKKVPHPSLFPSSDLDPLLNENVDQWPHLRELLQCYKEDWLKDEFKYGRYDSIPHPEFQNQIFEGPDTDVETEFRLANLRQGRKDDATNCEGPCTSGRVFTDVHDLEALQSRSSKHLGPAPLHVYEPVFNWEYERSTICGQRVPAAPFLPSFSGVRIAVKCLSLKLQAGLAEPIYGSLSLYHRERREKLSEDFHFQFLPSEFQEETMSLERRAIFSLDSPSPAVCMLIQLEKHATEDGGVKASVYSRKEPVHLTEREKQRLQVWARIMPFKEPFAWAIVPLFDANTAGSGGVSSPGSPSAPGLLGATTFDQNIDGKSFLGGKQMRESCNSPVVVEIPGLNRVKECYNEDWLQDPKHKVHKPVKCTLRLEVERLPADDVTIESFCESSSPINATVDVLRRFDTIDQKNAGHQGSVHSHGASNGHIERAALKSGSLEEHQLPSARISEATVSDFHALEFRMFAKNEPFTQLVHCLYAYPQSVSLSRKRNLFVRMELKKDDTDLSKLAIEGIFPRVTNGSMESCAYSQIAVNTRMAHYHDEFKVRLPAVLSSQHHLLFTFFHVDLQMKLEAPKPVVVGYSVLPLSVGAQLLRSSDGSLPIVRDLLPHYLQEGVKEKMEYMEDGRPVFKLRLRLCSSLYPVNERIRDFFVEFDRHILRTSPPWGSELLEAINSLKNVDSTSMIQFLQPSLNLLLHLIGDSGETLQVAAFRAMVNILTRVQQESSDGAERNRFLVQYVDYAFDDFGGRQGSVYPGLCNVWRGLARSKAKGYRVGPVYDDVLSMAWVFLELIVKSIALEQARVYVDGTPSGEDVPPLQLAEDVFRCISNLYDCLLTEVHERCKKGLTLAKRLNNSLAFFCYDLLSVIDPRQVFELVALYLDKFTGICQTALHECKLTFLQIICDHDLFIEMPGRDPSERNYLASALIQELFLTWDHDDLTQRSKATRILVVLVSKHEYDARYQKLDDKLYISQLYFQLIGLMLDEMPVFYNLTAMEKREVLVCVLQIVRHLDDMSLIKAWQQSVARTRLFFKLMEECLSLFEYRRAVDSLLLGASSRSPDVEGAYSPRYSDKLSPSLNAYFTEASRQELRPQVTPENGFHWKKLSPQLSSPSQPYSLREALAQAQSLRKGTSNRALRESLHPVLRQKLELWEENLSTAVSLQVLEVAEKFTYLAAVHSIATDYAKLDCMTAIFTSFLSHNQPLVFWKAFLPVFNNLFSRHGATLMGRENDRFLKQVAFHLLRLGVFRNESIRRRAVVGLQILVRSSFYNSQSTARLEVMLTITLSELMSEVQVTQLRSDGSLDESGEARRLRRSLKEIAVEDISQDLLRECGLPTDLLSKPPDGSQGGCWNWSEVDGLSVTLIRAFDAGVEHALLGPMMSIDKYATAESFHGLAWAYAHVPDLHIMWLLHLSDAHQEMHSWAEAAQCAVAVAGVIMQALVARNDVIWGKQHLEGLRKICPMLSDALLIESSAAEVEGYGASKLTVDSAVKYLQLANKLFAQAELFHFCAAILELIIPVYKHRHAYGQLAKCHTSLTGIYESILEQDSRPIPFIDATYYRVGFYGEHFAKLNRKEYVYREARDIRLGDIMEKLGHIYESQLNGNQTLHIIPDSRQVKADELQHGACYLQITSVDPVMEDEDLESRRERVSGQSTSARVFDRFLFDTPFTKNGKTQGGLEDQWKRRTVLQTEGSFPALVNRLLVIKSESREFSPIENAIGMIETRTAALRNELEDPRSSEADHLPRLQSLQRILQGSVAVQVNSGVLGVCTAFLSGEPASKLRSQELQQLIAALLEFMAVCKRAIRIHSRLIGEEDQDFHSQLVNGFQSLTAELSHYIPAILSEL